LRVIIHEDVDLTIDRIVGGDLVRKLRILKDLDDLVLDPEPPKGGWRWSSSRVGFLYEEGRQVRRLKLHASLPKYRFFYHHDPTNEVVFVMAVVQRDRRTYAPGAAHIQLIRERYDEYFERKLWLL